MAETARACARDSAAARSPSISPCTWPCARAPAAQLGTVLRRRWRMLTGREGGACLLYTSDAADDM
eukprot:3149197-Alexandrium_andersonii.AAC.1